MKKINFLISVFFSIISVSTVFAQVPAPTLISPADDYKNQNPPSSFSWNVAAGASGYQIGFSTSSNMNNTSYTSGIITQTSWTITSSDWTSLIAGTQYYWSVRSYSTSYGLGPWQTSRKIMRLQSPPNCAANPSPINGATNITISNPTLSWTNGGGNPIGYYIYFGTLNNPPRVSTTSGTSWSPGMSLLYSTTYYWKIVPYNTAGEATGCSIWSFTTQSLPVPGPAVNPFPSNGANNVLIQNLVLSWNNGSGGLPTGYKFYFGSSSNPQYQGLITNNYTSPPFALSQNSTYYWKIIPTNSSSDAQNCPVWSFSTGGSPLPAVNPNPPNSAINVNPTNVTLSWSPGGGGSPEGYALYFGSTNPPTFVSNIYSTSYPLPYSLFFNTNYYWRIVPFNNFGSPEYNSCPVWSFTTSQQTQQLSLTVLPITQTKDWGEVYSFDFTVTSNGNPVQNATIPIMDPIRSYSTYVVTGSDGKANYSYPVPPNTSNGTYTFNFTATKNGYITSSEVTRNVIVNHNIGNQLVLDVQPVSTQVKDWGQSYNFNITVTLNGIPVAGASIPVYDQLFGGNEVLITNSNGQATYSKTVPPNTSNGNYSFNFIASKTGTTSSSIVTRIVQVSHNEIRMIVTGLVNDSLKFGEMQLNHSSTKAISIKNAESSSGNLIIKLNLLTTPFQQASGTNNITIVPGETKSISVTFTPNAVGIYNQNLTIENNANIVQSSSLLENELQSEISYYIVKVNGICSAMGGNNIPLSNELTMYANSKQTLQQSYYKMSGDVNINGILYFSGDVYVDQRGNLFNIAELNGNGYLTAKNISGQDYILTPNYNFKFQIENEEQTVLKPADEVFLIPSSGSFYGFSNKIGDITFTNSTQIKVDNVFSNLPKIFDDIFKLYKSQKRRGRPRKLVYCKELTASTVYSRTYGLQRDCSIGLVGMNVRLGAITVNDLTFKYESLNNKWGGKFKITIPGLPGIIGLLKSVVDENKAIPVELINKDNNQKVITTTKDLEKTLNFLKLSKKNNKFSFDLEIEFIGIVLNRLVVEVSGVKIPLWNTGLFITRMQGGTEDISLPNWRMLANVDIETPEILIFGPPLSIVNFGIRLGPPWYFKGSGTLQLFKNDIADGIIEHDGELSKINVEGNLNLFELLKGGIQLSLTGSEFTGSAMLTLKTPQPIPEPFSYLQNLTLGSYRNDFSLDKIDAVIPQGTYIPFFPFFLPIDIATRFTFDNPAFPYFHFKIGPNFDNLIQAWKTDKNGKLQRNFIVKANTRKIMVSATNSQNLIEFTVKDPLGTTYDSTKAFYTKSPDTKQTIMIIDKPMKGNWTFLTTSNVDTIFTLGLNQQPTPIVKSPGSKMSRSNQVSIKINDFSDTLQVKVFYNKDNKNYNGIFIKQFKIINNANIDFIWQNDSIPNGEYYIYCEIDDGKNAPVYQYAPGSIFVQNYNFNFTPSNFTAVQSGDSAIKASWTKNNDPSIYAAMIYFKDISTGKTEQYAAYDTNLIYASGLKFGRKYEIYSAYLDTNYNKGPSTNSLLIVYKNHSVNNPPYFTLNPDEQIDFICTENKQYILTAEDADANSLNFSSPNLPNGAVISGNSLNWNPAFEQRGSYIVKLIVSDGMTSDTIKKQLNVFTQEQVKVNLSFYSPTLYHKDNMALKIYNFRATQDSLTAQIKNKRTLQQISVFCRRVDKFSFLGDFGLDHAAKSDLIVAQGDTLLASYNISGNLYSDFSVYDTLSQLIDNTSPSAVSDLQANNEGSNFAELNWTAPGDNGNTSNAFSYDIRYNYTKILNDTNFQNAHIYSNNMYPAVPGKPELLRINIKSLINIENHDMVYFAIKSVDASGNISNLSNCAVLGYVLNPDGLTAQIFDVYKINIHIDSTNKSLKTFKGKMQEKSTLMHYRLYRKFNESEFVLIKDNLLQSDYIDNLYENSDGTFKYCVQAVYDSGISDSLYSNSVLLDRFANVRIFCSYSDSTNNENIRLKLKGLDNVYQQSYDLTTDPSGLLVIDNVYKTYYSVEMSKTGYPLITDTVFINENNNQLSFSPLLIKVVHLDSDWNLFSSPLSSKDMSVNNILSGTSVPVYGFTENGYYNEDTLESGKGYWVRYDTSANVPVKGKKILPNYVPVQKGWNIIGPFDFSIPVLNIVSEPPGIISTQYYEYLSGYGYDTASILEPGKGYWVYSDQNGILQIPLQNFKIFSAPTQSPNIKDTRISIRLVDNKNRISYLYLVPENETSDKYLLPPVPPSSIFDVRFASNRFIENKSIEQTVFMKSAEFPVKISAFNLIGVSINVKDNINGTIINKTISEGTVLTINENIESFSVKLNDLIPTEFNLSQNYPNPFNPVTTIKYQVPKNSFVKIVIYDILGREIKKLVEEVKEPGFYSVKFDAKYISSGVYFYKMTAGDFNRVYKMVVLK